MIKLKRRPISAVAVSLGWAGALTLPAATVFAQQQLMLEEVVVTARKREESLQNAPLAVSAISGDSLKDSGIKNLADITEIVPNLQINRPSRDAAVYIRGVGPARGATNVTELSVGVYIDGVFMLKPYGQMIDLAEVESVQVLRGPQGTLFGKNTTGGAMLVTSVKPQEEFGGFASVTAGNDNRLNVQASLDVPLGDSLLTRLTVTSVKVDGFFEDPVLGDELSDENRQGAALQLRWLTSDSVTADFSFFHNRIREQQLAMGDCVVTNPDAQILANRLITPLSGFDLVSDFCEAVDDVYGGEAPYSATREFELDASQAAMTFNWDINDNHALKSITAWNYQQVPNLEYTNTYAGFPATQISLDDGESTQISQEFTLSGEIFDGNVRYTSGVFYMDDDTDTGLQEGWQGDRGVWASVAEGVPAGLVAMQTGLNRIGQEFKNSTFAAYTQWSWNVTDSFELTAGLRYGIEERELTSFRQASAAPGIAYADVPGAIIISDDIVLLPEDNFFNDATSAVPLTLADPTLLNDDDTFESVTPMVSASYSFEDAMIYLSYTEGYKAGGFSDFNTGEILQFNEESIASIELGTKLEFWENRVRLNAAVFQMEYDDMQLFVARPSTDPNVIGSFQGVTNAGAATIEGAELELTVLPAQGWLINFSASLASGEFDEFNDFISVANDDGTLENIPLDRSDENLPSLPESSFSLGVQYEWEVGNGSVLARVDASYRDEIYWGFDAATWDIPLAREESTTEAFTIYNARVSWRINDNFSVAAWGRNLADETYYDGGVGESANIGHVIKAFAPPRRYGLDLRYDF